MSKREAMSIMTELRILGFSDTQLLQFGTSKRQFAIQIPGYGTLYREQDWTSLKTRIQDYKGESYDERR